MTTTNRSRMLAHVGQLAERRRNEIGLGRVKFAKVAGVGSDSTVKTFEFGNTEPSGANKMKLEKALDWRRGVIRDVLDAAEAGQTDPSEIDMEYMDGREIPEPASKASELDDVELLTEVIRRLGGWRDALDVERTPAATPAQEKWQMFELAARHDTTTPKTGKI